MSDGRMSLDDGKLFGGQPSGLVENLQGNLRLPDIVQQSRQSQGQHIGPAHAMALSKCRRHTRYQQAMLEGAFMVAPDDIEP